MIFEKNFIIAGFYGYCILPKFKKCDKKTMPNFRRLVVTLMSSFCLLRLSEAGLLPLLQRCKNSMRKVLRPEFFGRKNLETIE